MCPTKFVGVTAEEVADENTGLYEFNTVDGHHVYLHDTDLLMVTYETGPIPRLTTTFHYDPEWVPDSLRATPLIVIAFENVRVIGWEEDSEALAAMNADPEAAASCGQMSDFEWDGDSTFDLLAFALRLWFTADSAEVMVRPT